MEMSQVVTVILAGGRASRLDPLTRERAKPAVPFGGAYRIVDFPLSNCLNSGLRKTLLLTQFESLNLERHINLGWQRYFHRESGEFIDVVPPQQRLDESWYKGTADAVYQNIYSLEKEHPEHVLILAGDHIYKMDYRRLVEFHVEKKADVTIGALRIRLDVAPEGFGVLGVDSDGRVIGFEEIPSRPRPIPGDEQHCLTSMGIYVFNTRFLFEHLCQDATRPSSQHDLGGDLVPSIIPSSRVFAFPFVGESREKPAYWRDMGTLDAYFEANMDLVSVDPQWNLYDEQWPLWAYRPNYPPAKFVFADPSRLGQALDSLVCSGSIISGGRVERSVLGPKTRINSFARVDQSILFEGVQIGRHAKVRRAIIEEGLKIPAGIEVGYDHDLDRKRGFTVTEHGVTVIAEADGLENSRESEGQEAKV